MHWAKSHRNKVCALCLKRHWVIIPELVPSSIYASAVFGVRKVACYARVVRLELAAAIRKRAKGRTVVNLRCPAIPLLVGWHNDMAGSARVVRRAGEIPAVPGQAHHNL